jgi:hypothetical protein
VGAAHPIIQSIPVAKFSLAWVNRTAAAVANTANTVASQITRGWDGERTTTTEFPTEFPRSTAVLLLKTAQDE